MVTPQERVAKSVSETTTTNKGELTVKAPPGAVSHVKAPKGMPIKLQPSGAF
jgi:hypothetical protein